MQWLKEAANRWPDKIAIIYKDVEISYAQLYDKALYVAYRLNSFNQKRIALQAENHINDCYIIHGAILAGIEIVMINKYLTEFEIKRQMEAVNTTHLITDKRIERCTVVRKQSMLENNTTQLSQTKNNNPEDILSIMFTSGTTGIQKAVPQRYINHFASAAHCKQTFTYNHDSIWLDVLPLFHISGLSILLRAVIDGCTVVLHEKFNAQQIITDIQQRNITHISLVPQTLERLLRHGLNNNNCLQGILIGGAKLDERLLKTAREANLPIFTSFGMTETCSQMITATPNDITRFPKSVGKVNGNITIEHSENGIGEIAVKGNNVIDGYLYPESANKDAFLHGYFLTGDIGYIAEGYLYILDRRKDLIISGGENIYPSEIEQVILSQTAVQAVCIIGISDKQWGQVPICLYEANNDMQDEIEKILTKHVAKYKHPKQIFKVQALKRTSNGKISRHQCKEWFLDEYIKA